MVCDKQEYPEFTRGSVGPYFGIFKYKGQTESAGNM
jgi:hypothetical protein